jgi:hypothetical protein
VKVVSHSEIFLCLLLTFALDTQHLALKLTLIPHSSFFIHGGGESGPSLQNVSLGEAKKGEFWKYFNLTIFFISEIGMGYKRLGLKAYLRLDLR